MAGRTALVTGGGVGIGLACARRLARDGASLVILGRESARRGAEELRAEGHDARSVECDLSDVDRARDVGESLARDVPVDVLVNNAGIIHREPAVEHSAQAWRRVMDVNLDATWALTQQIGAAMVGRGDGRIITIASLLSYQGGVNVVSYAASKHAVVGVTKALSNEWAASGVTVNCVAPGYISTDNTAALRSDPQREVAIRERIPAGRWGDPSDIAGAVAFLAGPDAVYVTGHVLVVDGGWMAR